MTETRPANGWALLPLVVFLGVYLVTSIVINDFYKVPITVAFLVSSAVALLMTKGLNFNDRLARFSKGAADKNIMLMVWIFILAGAFASSAKMIGAIDATVNLTLNLLPGNLLLVGIFVAACFISLSVGTSVGTIVALTPVAVGIAEKTGFDLPFTVAIIVGGAFFGDNLSFISDTTIAATKTQGCMMQDKFKVNSMIVMPAAILLLIYYYVVGQQVSLPDASYAVDWVKVIPYLVVLGGAVAGINVVLVLVLGIVVTLLAGVISTPHTFLDLVSSLGTGIVGMGELIIITLLAGGMLELIRYNGGITFIIDRLTRRINSKRGAEMSIAGLVCLANLCTANNTIAVISTGRIAKDIAVKFGIDARKSASIMDTFSCFIQGIIPYGAQMLIAAKLASISPLNIIEYLYYPMLLGVFATFAILFRYPKKYS